jgi:hypothetical protein
MMCLEDALRLFIAWPLQQLDRVDQVGKSSVTGAAAMPLSYQTAAA